MVCFMFLRQEQHYNEGPLSRVRQTVHGRYEA